VAEEAMMSVTEVENLANALTSLELPVKDQLVLKRKSLRANIAHYGQFHNIQEALHTSEQATSNAILQIIGREESMRDMEQLRLPTKKGGVGTRHLTALDGSVCKAGSRSSRTAGARQGTGSFQPFKR
jgi:hypothetical protein